MTSSAALDALQPAPAPAAAPTRLTVVAHTHWDREWYEPFEVFRLRLLDVLDEALDLLERDPRLMFTLDGQVAMVDDYLELRPQNEARLGALVRAGRLHIGPWYTQADSLLVHGEALIRNLALGLRRAEALGGAMALGYLPDQFGHAAQLPQLLNLFGIQAAVLWRGVGPERPPHAFRWLAPDGSQVAAWWLQDGYGTGRLLPSDPAAFAAAVERTLQRVGDWLGDLPLLLPVGDDHVRLGSWLPEAVELLRVARPETEVVLGGFLHHPLDQAKEHRVAGELRSPAFAPVLAGVASARVREKQMAARATGLLLSYAEPLAAWTAVGGAVPPRELLARAWRYLILNHAHDSAAGCGVDATHEDVKARYRWAEQLGTALRDQLLSRLQIAGASGQPAAHAIYRPGPAAAATTAELEVPAALVDPLVAIGPDGQPRPVQPLVTAGEGPLFEGEFGPEELAVFIEGLDPATPLFSLYLVAIQATPLPERRLRIDVTLGPQPVPPAELLADQSRVRRQIDEAQRIWVVIHKQGATRRVLVRAGHAPELGFVPVEIVSGAALAGEAAATLEREGGAARALDPAGGVVGIASGPLTVTAEPDGSVLITDGRAPLDAVRANVLVDDGDRGDLYHHDPVPGAQPVSPTSARAEVVEDGPLRARLRITQDLLLPEALTEDRQARSAELVSCRAVTEVTLYAGERRVELATTFDNRAADHRLRAFARIPFRGDRLDVHHGLAVIERPLDPEILGGGVERPSRTGPHHDFVDVSDGFRGVALMARGLPEHEVILDEQGTALALTLVRSVGWLARGDLGCVDHAVGPIVPTPDAQEPGTHRFEYALLLHQGTWEGAGVVDEARAYLAPSVGFEPRGSTRVPAARALVEVLPRQVVLLSASPGEQGLVVRLLNASPREVVAELRPALRLGSAALVDPLERPIPDAPALDPADLRIPLRGWQIATLRLTGC